jgi:hypothetical protein
MFLGMAISLLTKWEIDKLRVREGLRGEAARV